MPMPGVHNSMKRDSLRSLLMLIVLLPLGLSEAAKIDVLHKPVEPDKWGKQRIPEPMPKTRTAALLRAMTLKRNTSTQDLE